MENVVSPVTMRIIYREMPAAQLPGELVVRCFSGGTTTEPNSSSRLEQSGDDQPAADAVFDDDDDFTILHTYFNAPVHGPLRPHHHTAGLVENAWPSPSPHSFGTTARSRIPLATRSQASAPAHSPASSSAAPPSPPTPPTRRHRRRPAPYRAQCSAHFPRTSDAGPRARAFPQHRWHVSRAQARSHPPTTKRSRSARSASACLVQRTQRPAGHHAGHHA